MMSPRPAQIDDDLSLAGPYDAPAQAEDLWFLSDADDATPADPLAGARASTPGLVDGAGWREAEAGLAAELTELAFDAGRLAERQRGQGLGAAQRLALEEAASLSWWTGDRVSADRLALWLSYRIGAADEGGEGLIRTAWAARRLMAPVGQGGDLIAATLGEDARGDAALWADAAVALEAVAGLSAITRGCATFHLWRALDERPDHLRGIEAAVLAARLAGQGPGRRSGLAFLPLSLAGFAALTASGTPERRLAGWIAGAHQAVLAALLSLDRLADWRGKAEMETADLSGRTPGLLIAALTAQPMLAAPQAEAETGASRAAVQRNLDLLVARGLTREVTGQGRFRVWAARV